MDYDVSDEVIDAKNANEASLLSYPNVRTVGAGRQKVAGKETGIEAIVVGVSRKVPEEDLDPDDVLPAHADGVRVDVQEVGEIEPQVLRAQLDRRGPVRPVPQGVSVAHPEVTAGSTGWMYDTGAGFPVIGSNNHVLANSNAASTGDDVLQPGPADGGTTDDQIGVLESYVPVENGVDVDLATARVDPSVEIANELGEVNAPIAGVVDSLAVGDELVKSGRTTGVTRGQIQQLGATVNVNYGGSLGTIQVEDCIITEAMSQGGDSGSSTARLVNDELLAAGRLFAGSSQITVHHNIDNELRHLRETWPDVELLTDGATSPPTASVEIRLDVGGNGDPSTGTIEATILRDDDGAPIEGADVSIDGETSGSESTGPDGVATFAGVPIGAYTVTASASGESGSAEITAEDFD